MSKIDALLRQLVIPNKPIPKLKKNGIGSLDNVQDFEAPNESEAQKRLAKNEVKREKYKERVDKSLENSIWEATAMYYPIKSIFTDPSRFQNRTDAFSELSAQNVEKNYNPNFFDPIVIWLDSKDSKFYVLSGHSRYEGLKRRGEKRISARLFEGTEAKAIEYSRIIANRAATKEDIIEDIAAYKLARDGDLSKDIAPATNRDLKQAFDNTSRLDAYTFLNPKGMFIEALKSGNTDQYKKLNAFSIWAGQLKEKYSELTNTHEDDMFLFLYADDQNSKIKKDDFIKLVEERLATGAQRIFPECSIDEGCKPIKSYRFLPPPKDRITKMLIDLQEDRERIQERRASKNLVEKIHTREEAEALIEVEKKLIERQKKLKEELKEADKGNRKEGLFGFKSRF